MQEHELSSEHTKMQELYLMQLKCKTSHSNTNNDDKLVRLSLHTLALCWKLISQFKN